MPDSGSESDPDSGTDGTDSGTDGTEDGTSTGELPGASRPDLDGDGEIDWVFSARGHDAFTGAVWIDYGADAIEDGPDGADTRLDGGNNLGLAVTICDLDGDDVDELIAASLAGIHVYWGGVQLADGAQEDLLITSADQLSVVGGLSCGDVTGDGTPDIVAAGSTFASWSLTMVPGGADLRDVATLDADTAAGAVHIDSSDGSLLPASGIGDLNGDDVADIIIGASSGGMATPAEGAVYVFFGGGTLATGTEADADVTLLGSAPSAAFGSTLAVGDVNGDGLDDIAIAERGSIVIYPGEAGFADSAAAAGGLLAPGARVAAEVGRQFLFGGDAALPAAAQMLLLSDDEFARTVAAQVSLGGSEAFVIIDDALSSEVTACAVAVDDTDQTPVNTVPWPFSEIIAPPRAGIIDVPVLLHGRTNEFTFQPEGDGSLARFNWQVDADCSVFQTAEPIINLLGLPLDGTPAAVWAEEPAWSARNVSLGSMSQ